VPAQQLAAVGSQASPVAVHTGSPGDGVTGSHAAAPGGPTHAPPQQSSDDTQPAPAGAQASRQA
jgi:hypothetical protein